MHVRVDARWAHASRLQPRMWRSPALHAMNTCRSVTMDSWNPDQLKKMQAGGNGKLNTFLKNYGIDKYMDISDKYNSKAAEVGRGHKHSTAGCWKTTALAFRTCIPATAARLSLRHTTGTHGSL
jgi:ADP-ribosylation factor GTPase-activating protein 1